VGLGGVSCGVSCAPIRIKLRGTDSLSPPRDRGRLVGEGQGEGEKPAAARCPLTPTLSHGGERETGDSDFDTMRGLT